MVRMKPSTWDMLRTANDVGLAKWGGRAAMANPRLTARILGMAAKRGSSRLPSPWQPKPAAWLGMAMPWRRQRGGAWMMREAMPWQRQRRGWWMRQAMPWEAGRRDRWALHPLELLAGAAMGGALMYLFDPEHGNRRRKMAAQRSLRLARQARRGVTRSMRKLGSDMAGKRQALMHLRDGHELLDDATLAHKVESVLFRDPQVPKGQINVNAEHGVVVLRGTVDDPNEIGAIERTVRRIHGVQEVHSLLHPSGTSAT
jgi:hypothetical protein